MLFRRLSGTKKGGGEGKESPKAVAGADKSAKKTPTSGTSAPPPPPPDDDDDIPPPPDDDFVPPPPAPLGNAKTAAKTVTPPASTKSSPASLPPKAPSPANRTPSPAHGERPRSATKPKFLDDDDFSEFVDPEYIDMTVVPILLRSKFAYDEANKFGDVLKKLHDSDVKVLMAGVQHLCDKIKSSGIKGPANWEKLVMDDMFWQKGGAKGNRKSFVYYAPEATPAERPKSSSNKSDAGGDSTDKKPNRHRTSFSGGPQPVVSSMDEGDANRYKVVSRRDKAESVSKDLMDLVAELGAIESGKRS